MIQRITVHTIYQSMIRFHRFFSQRRNIYFAEMSNFVPLISIWKELKKTFLNSIHLQQCLTFFLDKKNVYVSVNYQFQISCVIKHIKRKADKWTTNQSTHLSIHENSSLIVFGKVIFTKQCLLHLSRVDTCIFISFTFKSHIYNVHLVKSELKLGDTITNMPNNSTIFICIYISSFLLTSFRNTSAHP